MSEWKTQNTKCSNNNQLGLAMNKFAVAKAVVTRHLDAHNFVHTKRYVAILLCIWQLFPVRSLCGSFCLFLDTLIRLNSQITQCNYIVCSCVCVCCRCWQKGWNNWIHQYILYMGALSKHKTYTIESFLYYFYDDYINVLILVWVDVFNTLPLGST